jgi:hypothetical protein
MVKCVEKPWSVAADRIREKIRPSMSQAQVDAIEEEALDQARSDVYGASWRERVRPDGTIAEGGIGSDHWLCNVDEQKAAQHWAAVGRFIGPQAEKAGRERIARLKAARGIKT